MQRAKVVRVKEISSGLVAQFCDRSKEEWDSTYDKRQFVKSLHGLWVFYRHGQLVFLLGLAKRTMLGMNYELIFFRGKTFRTYSDVRLLQRLVTLTLHKVRKLSARVVEDDWIGRKFVEFLGFKPTYIDDNVVWYELVKI